MEERRIFNEGVELEIFDDFAKYLRSSYYQAKLSYNISKSINPLLEPSNDLDVSVEIVKLFKKFNYNNYEKFNLLFAQFESLEDIKNNREKYFNQILALALSDLFEEKSKAGVHGIKQSIYAALNLNHIMEKLIAAFGDNTVRMGLLMAYIGLIFEEIMHKVIENKFNAAREFKDEFARNFMNYFYQEPYGQKALQIACDSIHQRNNILRGIRNNPQYQYTYNYYEFEEERASKKQKNSIANSGCSSARIRCAIGGGLVGSGGGLGAGVGIGVLAAPPTGGFSLLFASIVAASTVVGGVICGVASCIAAPYFEEPVNENKDGYKLLRPQSQEMENIYGEKDTATLFSDNEEAGEPRASRELFTEKEDNEIFADMPGVGK